MLIDILINLVKIVAIVFGFVLGLAGMMTLLGDRKQSALIQNRIGPNRARIFGIPYALIGIPHFLADGLKLVLKEHIVPEGAHKGLHAIAPALILLPALIGWAGVPFMDAYCNGTITVDTNTWREVCSGTQHDYFQIMNMNAGLLFAFAVASISVYGAAIAGWASNSNYSLLGGLRSSAQMISYEVTMGISLAGIIMIYGTLDLNEMVRQQGYLLWGWLPMWGIVVQPLAFFLFFLAGMAETKRAPFDLPEGESEIVAGYLTEYSSMKFAGMQLSEYAATVFIGALLALMFLGGWQVPYLYADGFRIGTMHLPMPGQGVELLGTNLGYLLVILLRITSMCAKIVVIVWLQFMMRWTLPRFRYDQVMVLGWKILLPLSLANLVITAFLLAIF